MSNTSGTIVRSGDTLVDIAKNHGISFERLLELNPQFSRTLGNTNSANGRDPNKINVGEQIVVDGKTPNARSPRNDNRPGGAAYGVPAAKAGQGDAIPVFLSNGQFPAAPAKAAAPAKGDAIPVFPANSRHTTDQVR